MEQATEYVYTAGEHGARLDYAADVDDATPQSVSEESGMQAWQRLYVTAQPLVPCLE